MGDNKIEVSLQKNTLKVHSTFSILTTTHVSWDWAHFNANKIT